MNKFRRRSFYTRYLPTRSYRYILTAIFVIWLFHGVSLGVTYYVDPAKGKDSNPGNDPDQAWQSLERVNDQDYQPGDSILFRSGAIWKGTLTLKGSGEANKYITVDKYGEGALPVINGNGNETAILLENSSYWIIQNLEITNPGQPEVTIRSGVYIQWTGEEQAEFGHIKIRNLLIHDIDGIISRSSSSRRKKSPFWYNAAICIKNRNKNALVRDILIEGCTLRDVRCVGCSINFGGSRDMGTIEDVVFRNNLIERTGADAVTINKTKNVLVEYNRCYDAGALGEGSTTYIAGMWVGGYTHNSVYQYNEVARTRTFSGDGNAFDIDIGVSGTHIFQYNYTHENEGGPLMVMPGDGQKSMIIFRYNVCVDDYKSPHPQGKPAFWISTRTIPLLIYNNTFYLTKDVQFTVGNSPLVQVRNNIFYTPMTVIVEHPPAPAFAHNCFFGKHNVQDENGIISDPWLVDPGPAKDGMDNVKRYMIRPHSPCRDAGMVIPDNGNQDLWGNLLYHGKPDIGAHEISGDELKLPEAVFAAENIRQEVTYAEENPYALSDSVLTHAFDYSPGTGLCESVYDRQGKRIFSIWYRRDAENNSWLAYSKCEYNYDQKGYCISHLYFDWNTVSRSWTEDNKYEFAYDQNGNITLWASYNKEVVSNKWLGDWNHVFGYDQDGNWIMRINYWDWDEETESWIPTIKRETYYDQNSKWTSSSSENWDSYIDYRWDNDNNSWVNSRKGVPAYDQDGKLISFINYEWDAGNNSWVNNYKHEFTYDRQGDLILIKWYDWETESNSWLSTRKYEYVYNKNGNLLTYERYEWDIESNTWVSSNW